MRLLIGAGTPREAAARGLAYLLFVYTEDAVAFILVAGARDGLAILAIAIIADSSKPSLCPRLTSGPIATDTLSLVCVSRRLERCSIRGGEMPAVIVFDDQVTFVTDPVSPCAGEDFTVSWQEKNIGDEDSSEYQDIFDLNDQGSGDSKTLQNDPLPAGQSATRSLNFNLPAGNYVMTLVINAQGALTLGNVIIDECL
jgi:hypothetical protein